MRLRELAALVVAGALPATFAVAGGSAGVTKLYPHCASAARIAQLPRWQSGGLVRADMNGDSRIDTVTIRFDRSAPGRCAFYLRISTSKRTYSLKLGRLVGNLGKFQANKPIREWWSRAPAVEAIVDLGGRGNLIALADNEGAADLLVDFVGLSNGRFHVIPMSLDLGGPITYESRASCTRGGALRHWEVWNAWTKKHPNRWAFAIDTYRRHGWRIDAVAHRTVYGSVNKMWRAARRAGIPRRYLVGCSLARNPDF